MGLFKNKEAKEQPHESAKDAAFKILGSGCASCKQLEKATKEAMEKLGIDEMLDYVTDFKDIVSYGVMSTPALVVDGKVLSYGKVLRADQIVELIKKVRQ